MVTSRFKITDFTNPSGQRVYRVSGTLHGKTVRKNFPKRADAVAYRQELDIEVLNATTDRRVTPTLLSPERNRDAMAAVAMLDRLGKSLTLLEAVNIAVRHHVEDAKVRTVKAAIGEYLKERQKDHRRGAISVRQLRTIHSEFGWMEIALGEEKVSEISAQQIKGYMESRRNHPRKRRPSTDNPSLKTWNNRRGLLNTFFEFCVARKYVGVNPVTEVAQYRIKHRRSNAETLTDEQAQDLMTWGCPNRC